MITFFIKTSDTNWLEKKFKSYDLKLIQYLKYKNTIKMIRKYPAYYNISFRCYRIFDQMLS